jgi:membrane fusion protein (multidrug efflux system)
MLLRWIPAVTALVILAGCGDSSAPAAPPPLELQVARVQKRDLPLSREFVGRTVGSIDAAVRARVDGTLIGMHFEEGTEVKEGQLLYEIDPAPFIANLAAAQGELAEAQTSLAEAIADHRRVVPLAKIDAVSQRDLDLAIAKKGVAEGAVKAAEANVESKQIELSYCTITSPASGTIGFTKAKVGEYVGRPPNPTILNTVSQLEPIDVQFNLSERDYLYFARLAAGDESQKGSRDLQLILADGTISPGTGKVVKLDRGIDAQSGAILAEAAFPNPGKLLRPGLFAKVRTVAEVRKDAVLVPKRAIKELQGRYFVFVVNDAGVVEQRSIEVGPLSGDLQVVELGLKGDETIAIDGIQRLRSGMTIKPKLVNLPE